MQRALTLCLFGLQERDDGVRDGDWAAVAMGSWTENAMIETPAYRYSYPLGPKVEEIPIPVGYVKLGVAIEELGQAMFPGDWTGEERETIRWNTFGQEFRSNVEFETDREFRDEVLMAQCEIECELYGGDPKLRHQKRSNFAEGYVPYVPMDDLPPLSTESLKEIEGQFTENINQATAVRERREKVEDTFLREMLWAGLLQSYYAESDGQLIEIEPHIWGSVEGRNYLKYGWKEVLAPFDERRKTPILILESDLIARLTNGGDDEELLNKMEILLRTDPKVRSINAAADALVSEAVGGGTDESRAKRLARKYKRADKYNPKDSS